MDDRFNTIAGWVLFAGIVALSSSILGGELFKSERPEKMGYPIAGVSNLPQDTGPTVEPIEARLAKADVAHGGDIFKKCQACHNADKGGANQLGPNLWGVIGVAIAEDRGGFAFSDALKKVGGSWNWHNLDDWLTSPRTFAPGTKMTFAGLGDPMDRADVIAFLNTHSDAPLPLPAPPKEAAPAGAGPNNGPQKAEKEPVLTEQQTGANPKNIGGPGAPKVSGPASIATKKPGA